MEKDFSYNDIFDPKLRKVYEELVQYIKIKK